MQGLNGVHALTKDAIEKTLMKVYKKPIYNIGQIEDIVLFTSERTNYSNIGTDCIRLSKMMYMLENIYWINVCLFVNKDFRSCFDDAIAIEKALLQVNDIEYNDFREDMILADEEDAMGDKSVPIDLSNYSDKMEMAIMSRLDNAAQVFYRAGMTDVYDDLIDTFDRQLEAEIMYTIHNMVYVINAMNRNGVFNKYVRLVVDSVKKQLS